MCVDGSDWHPIRLIDGLILAYHFDFYYISIQDLLPFRVLYPFFPGGTLKQSSSLAANVQEKKTALLSLAPTFIRNENVQW